MSNAIAFDVYPTLVDPLEMNQHLAQLVGEKGDRFAQLWREKSFEYAFGRGLMHKYETFGVCTKQALLFAMQTLKVDLDKNDQDWLIEEYQNLQAFPDVVSGLQALKTQ